MVTALLTLLLGIIVILAIIAANGYFVAQEFAYMSVDRARLAVQANQGDKAAQSALKVTKRTSFMLSGAQLGITVTGLMVGYVAEPLVGASLAALFEGIGIPAAVSISVGTILALAISTIVQMIFGELYPKNLAIANPEPLSLALARSTNIYLAVFGWLIKIFDYSANALLKLFRIEPVHDVDSSATVRDLEHIVADSRESGDLPKGLSLMLDRILDFPERDVEHAMIPRSRADSVEPDMAIGEVRALMAAAHTRYPVINDEDEPVGVVHLSDVLATSLDENEPISKIMAPPVVAPTLMSLPEARSLMMESGEDLICVIDEYGGFAGILTTEDLAEEIVGEITDEHDEEPAQPISSQGEGIWQMAGDVHIDEAEREIGWDLPRGDYETLAGLLIAHRGALPEADETVTVKLPDDPSDLVYEEPVERWLDARVLEVERRVPTLVRLTLHETPGDDPVYEDNLIRRNHND